MRFCVSAEHGSQSSLQDYGSGFKLDPRGQHSASALSLALLPRLHTPEQLVSIQLWRSTAQDAMEISVTLFPDAMLIHFGWR